MSESFKLNRNMVKKIQNNITVAGSINLPPASPAGLGDHPTFLDIKFSTS